MGVGGMAQGRKPAPKKYAAAVVPLRGEDVPADVPAEREPFKVPACPDHFSDDAREVWVFMCEHLDRVGLWGAADVFKLMVFCVAVADWHYYRRIMNDMDGRGIYETRGRNGWQRKNRPEYGRMKDAEERIMRIGSDFGLDPVARQRLRLMAAGGEPEQGDLLGSLDTA